MKKKVLISVTLLILLICAFVLKKTGTSSDMVNYTLLFPKIGGLQSGDIVSINGLYQGTVTKIYLHDAQVAVQIEIDKFVKFTDSSTVSVQTIGLLGERKVEITLSPLGDLYRPDTDSSVNYIPGKYQNGLSEVIGIAGDILQRTDTIISSVGKIVDTNKTTTEVQ